MAKIYSWRFRVRSYEMGVNSQVGPATFLHYLEEGAIQASGASGYTYEWYRENHRLWVIRKLTVRYDEPAGYGDELALQTWVSDLRRVQSHREYDLRRVKDGRLVVRARANWVFMNTDTMQIQRVPDEAKELFEPTEILEDLDTAVIDPVPVAEPAIHVEARRVQRHELDANGHVNNAVYLQWAEQAQINALRAASWPPERFDHADFTMRLLSNETEYMRSALDDEPIEIITRLAEVGRERAAWHTEIMQRTTKELLAKNKAVYAFFSGPTALAIPDALYHNLQQRIVPK